MNFVVAFLYRPTADEISKDIATLKEKYEDDFENLQILEGGIEQYSASPAVNIPKLIEVRHWPFNYYL